MKKTWTLGLDDDVAREIEADYKGASRLRARLSDIIKDKIEKQAQHGRSDELYDSPNWQLTQADTNGQIRSCEYLLSLIKD